jgi:hypothetical protein
MALHLLAFDTLIISGSPETLNPTGFPENGNAAFPPEAEIPHFL